MRETFPSRELAIAQLTCTMTLAEYLTDAMEEIKKHNVNVDTLNLKFDSTLKVS
jgi:hypothetical protein